MRKKATKKVQEIVVRKPSFKDASTQTYRYVEYMPPPIILDIKSEAESDNESNGFEDAFDETEVALESLKIEINENIVMEEPLTAPVEEFIFEEKVNPAVIQPFVQIPQLLIPQPSVAPIKRPRKRSAAQEKSSTNKTKAKRAKKDKEPAKNKKAKAPELLEIIDCQLCSFTCKRPSHLKRHMLMHTGEKPHKCSHCEKRFAQKTDLNRHAITHAANYDFHCTLCGRGFPDAESAAKHEKRCNTKRYVCDICNYMTFSVGNLHLHKRKHTGER